MTASLISRVLGTVAMRRLPQKLTFVLVLTAVADWLFYEHRVGVSLALFASLLSLSTLYADKSLITGRRLAIATALLGIAYAPHAVEVSILSVAFVVVGTVIFSLKVTGRMPGGFGARTIAVWWVLLSGPVQLFCDLIRLGRSWAWRSRSGQCAAGLKAWIVPALFGAVFLFLFTAANPLIEGWLAELDPSELLAEIDAARLAFWFAVPLVCWPFIRLRYHSRFTVRSKDRAPFPGQAEPEVADWAFIRKTTLRSLVLFNALFAVQTVLDITYLWGGVALPDGMSYATYAHRGAFPLIATAILAGLFVLAALRPGSAAERSFPIRVLVYCWVAQNLLLVLSSMLRLDLYIEVYSLSYWRLAAFLWMLLVALGLVLIVSRIVLNRSNGWLVSMNAGAVALTLYACGFANFPQIVASYNVTHSRELSGQGVALDQSYLCGLGAQSIPAMDRYLTQVKAGQSEQARALEDCRRRLADEHLQKMADWRAWSLRGWWLARYLAAHQIVARGQEELRRDRVFVSQFGAPWLPSNPKSSSAGADR